FQSAIHFVSEQSISCVYVEAEQFCMLTSLWKSIAAISSKLGSYYMLHIFGKHDIIWNQSWTINCNNVNSVLEILIKINQLCLTCQTISDKIFPIKDGNCESGIRRVIPSWSGLSGLLSCLHSWRRCAFF